jgi:type II secretory pathway pseudopilin PulG
MKQVRAFTFIEVLIVLVLVIGIGVFLAAFSGHFFLTQNVQGFFEVFRSDIRKAQISAMEGRGGSSWGVAYRGDALILFRGSDYDHRESAFDEAFDVPRGISFSGFDEVTAERGTGRIDGTRSSIHMEGIGEVKNFSLSEEGALLEE